MYQNNRNSRNCNCGCNQNNENYCTAHCNNNNRTVFYFNDEPAEVMTYQAKYGSRWNYDDGCDC